MTLTRKGDTTVSENKWAGRKVTTARAKLAALLPSPCYRCGRIITGDKDIDGDTWDVDHVTSRAEGGDHDLTNLTHSHSRCNRRHGGKLGNERKAKAKEVRVIETERTVKFWSVADLKSIIRVFQRRHDNPAARPLSFLSLKAAA